MMRKGRAGDLELVLNLADDQALRVSGKQQLHDAQPRLGSHGGKHVGIASDAFAVGSNFAGNANHISIIPEIRMPRQEEQLYWKPLCRRSPCLSGHSERPTTN